MGETVGTVRPVDKALSDLCAAVKSQKRLPTEYRNNSITVCSASGKDEAIIVNGSAHMLHDRFVELFKARPELRAVVQDVLNEMYQIADR